MFDRDDKTNDKYSNLACITIELVSVYYILMVIFCIVKCRTGFHGTIVKKKNLNKLEYKIRKDKLRMDTQM